MCKESEPGRQNKIEPLNVDAAILAIRPPIPLNRDWLFPEVTSTEVQIWFPNHQLQDAFKNEITG